MNNALYNQIRIFQSIAREGNISAAARKLEITPPSVSNALKLLEEYIGHPLFVRTTRRIELTETGQLLLEQTAAAVESLENSLESIRDQHQEPSGMVRITLSRFAYRKSGTHELKNKPTTFNIIYIMRTKIIEAQC